MTDLHESTIPSFNPPGFPHQDDQLNADQKKTWSDTISGWMEQEISATDLWCGCGEEEDDVVPRTKLTQFFNGTQTPFDTKQKPALVSWHGFPKKLSKDPISDEARWKAADATRWNQDEYCEWTVKRDKDSRIVSVTFTCEGPEYWKYLCEHEPDKMLALYKENNPEFAADMKMEDFFTTHKGKRVYQPYNKWNGVLSKNSKHTVLETVNPGCIMHLAQKNNSLSAEIDIAAQGTVLRKDKDGKLIEGADALIRCSNYGNPDRESDPKIGDNINSLARDGKSVSIADPVGIYFVDFESGKFMLDQDGSGDDLVPVPKGTFRWVRGNLKQEMGLRLHIQIPDGVKGTGDNEGRQLTVSDLIDKTSKVNVNFGAQFADYLHVGVHAVTRTADKIADPLGCPCEGFKPKPKPAADANDQEPRAFAVMAATDDGPVNRFPIKTRHD